MKRPLLLYRNTYQNAKGWTSYVKRVFKASILKKKKEARLILQSGIYIYIFFTNISEGTAFLLQGLTYNDEVRLRCVLKTLKKEGRLCLPRYSNALYAFLLQGLACNDEVKLRYVRP